MIRRPLVVPVDHADPDDPHWQYLLEHADTGGKVVEQAQLFSEKYRTDAASHRLQLVVVNGGGQEGTKAPNALPYFPDLPSACRQEACPMTLQTDVTPLEAIRLYGAGSDGKRGFLERASDKDYLFVLLSRAQWIQLEVDLTGVGKRTVRFAPGEPLVVPLPQPKNCGHTPGDADAAGWGAETRRRGGALGNA